MKKIVVYLKWFWCALRLHLYGTYQNDVGKYLVCSTCGYKSLIKEIKKA